MSGKSLGPDRRDPGRLRRAEIVPEAAVWNSGTVRRHLEEVAPDVVILQTARAYRPELLDGPWVTVLDLVDRLSASYRQRASLSKGARARAFSSLAHAHERFEEKIIGTDVRAVAAGLGDAERMGVTWIPNLVDPTALPADTHDKPFDVVFFGSLGYRPNVEALNWLAEGRPAAVANLRVLVAGHAPSDEVRSLCARRGWSLVEDYPSNEWLAEQASVAIAPLRSTAGIQNKVLEAATIGLPQVVAPAALAGLQDGFPALVADTPDEFVARTLELVHDAAGRARLAEDAWSYTHRHYTTDAWVPELWRLVNDGDAVSPPFVNVAPSWAQPA